MFQLDVKNVFLYGDLHEEIFMEQPLEFVAQGERHMVCRLKKALYGLKQSPQAWFDKLSGVLMLVGFIQCHLDHSVLVKSTASSIVVLLVYVADIIVLGSDVAGIEEVREYMCNTPKYTLTVL